MNNFYKKFNLQYDKKKLGIIFNRIFFQQKYKFDHPFCTLNPEDSKDYISEIPMEKILGESISKFDFGFAKMLDRTLNHINPRNNGLIIFPVEENLKFCFENTFDCIVDLPTATNGKIVHKYGPISKSAIFFAYKIPITTDWGEILDKIESWEMNNVR